MASKVVKSDPMLPKGHERKEPGPGLHPAGPHQVMLRGSEVRLYITAGSAQIDIPVAGRCFVPDGARYRERPEGTGRFSRMRTARSSPGDAGIWLDEKARRVVFLNGRAKGSAKTPVLIEGETTVFVRGFNAVIQYGMKEQENEFEEYRFDIRDLAREAREERSRQERLDRLNSPDPFVRQRQEFIDNGGVYGMIRRDSNGVFKGF